MSPAEIATILASLAALIGSGLAIYKMRRVEGPASDVDVAGKYRAMAMAAAGNEMELKHRIDELEGRVDELQAAQAEAETYIQALEAYVVELVELMKTHNMQPVRQKPVRRGRA